MNEQGNNQIPPEENTSQNMDEQSGNIDMSKDESAPYQSFPYPPQQEYDYNNYLHEERSGSGCLGIFIKTVLIILAVLAFAFFACLFMLSGPC